MSSMNVESQGEEDTEEYSSQGEQFNYEDYGDDDYVDDDYVDKDYVDYEDDAATTSASEKAVAKIDMLLDEDKFSGLKDSVDGLLSKTAPVLASVGSGLPPIVTGADAQPAQLPSVYAFYQELFATKDSAKRIQAQVSLKGAREKNWRRRNLGNQHGGYFAPDQGIEGEKTGTYMRRPRSHYGERTEQVLHQISVKLFNFAQNNLTEVQTMMVDGRMIVSANESKGDSIIRRLKAAEFASLREFLISDTKVIQSERDQERLDAVRQVAMENVQQIGLELAPDREEEADDYSVFYATQTDAGDREHLERLFGIIRNSSGWETGGVAEAIAWLNRDDTEYGIFWCDPAQLGPDGTVHAEQALAIILARSNRKGSDAWISGTMRACTGCYLTFEYAKGKLGLSINANKPMRPGGAWDQSQALGFAQLVMSGPDIDIREIHENWKPILREWEEQGKPKGPKARGFTQQRNKLQETFAKDIGSRWQREVGDRFPRATYGTELPDDDPSDEEDKLKDTAPDKQYRRTKTMSASDLSRYFEIRGIEPKGGSEKEAEDDDEDEPEESSGSKRKRSESTGRSSKKQRKEKK